MWYQPATHGLFAGPRQIQVNLAIRAWRLRKYPAEEVEKVAIEAPITPSLE